MASSRKRIGRTRRPLQVPPRSLAGRLAEAEALFRDFTVLTPDRYRPFVKTFESFDDYHRWRRAQKNRWYR